MAFEVRNGTFHFIRRIPKRYRPVDERAVVKVSLHTDSRSIAETKAREFWRQMIETWEARLAGESDEAEKAYEAARNIAQIRGFRFLPMREVAELPTAELVARILASADRTGKPNMRDAAAILGKVERPSFTVSSALDLFWRLAADRLVGKSEDQVRRWRNPRIKAVKGFTAVNGDMALEDIGPDDMQDWRDVLLERVVAGEIVAHSANRDLIHFRDVVSTVVRAKRLAINPPLSGWMLRSGAPRRRPSFSNDWIRNKLLAPGGLAGLNDQARCLLLGMVNTGYRPSEGQMLGPAQIRLDAEIPHISIEPNGRTLKSENARRKIPLLGVSLEAFQQFPEGFSRYRDSASATQTINKFMVENGLRETDDHTLYSLRHSFQDRMIAAGIDDRIRRDLFGHALTEEAYGEGATLQHRARLLAPISF